MLHFNMHHLIRQMKLIRKIKPYLIQALTSDFLLNIKRKLAEKKRINKHLKHQVTVYLAIDDPASYLLLQTLTGLEQRYQLSFDFITVLNKPKEMFPAPLMWQTNAFEDSTFMAQLYHLDFPTTPPQMTLKQKTIATTQLLHNELQGDYLAKALAIFTCYWHGDNDGLSALINPVIQTHTECYHQHLSHNETMLKTQGHYQSAMLYYGGEWYWGLERLHYLEKRLNALHNSDEQGVQFDKNRHIHQSNNALPTNSDNKTPLTMYFSIRSPYSYIGLVRAKRLAAHFQIPLVVKPVLPMVMRRMLVPKVKGMYIIGDVKREAATYNIPFGRVADPLGAGVQRCYSLYEYACDNQRGIEFLLTYAQSVWSQGVHSDTDAGLKIIVEQSGLNWLDAKQHLGNDRWKQWANRNLLDLYQHNKWGVPSFNYENTTVFGQDKLLKIQQAIESTTL